MEAMMKMLETWVIYALIAFMGYFFVNLIMRMVSSENPLVVTLVFYATATLALLLFLAARKEFSISTRGVALSMVIGIFSIVATVFFVKSISIAPNPGYTAALSSANFVLLAIVSVFVFRSPLTPLKFLGIVATLIGLILLTI